MMITIVRHEKVDMSWDKKYNSATYDLACSKYDECPIISGAKENFETDNTKTVYISELSRTYETACKLFENRNFIKTPLLNEVPLRSFKDTENNYPLWLWDFMGRLQWLIQNKRQAEGKKETVARAKEMITLLEENKKDCYAITHGFFMRVFIRELKRQGYRIEKSSKLSIANMEKIIAVKCH